MTSVDSNSNQVRSGWFFLLVLLVTLVGDGWSGRPLGLTHQLLLIPITLLFLFAAWRLLFGHSYQSGFRFTPRYALVAALVFEILAALLFFYACRHFAAFGYRLHPLWAVIVFLPSGAVLAYLAAKREPSPKAIFSTMVFASAGGLALAIISFPLTYLRSDMLPVILWADTNLLHHIDPYATMYVGGRVYDFPYLPGMIVAYLPVVASHLDIRFGSLAYDLASAGLFFWAARNDRRREMAALLAVFFLCPFLQYRHELYLQPHWFTLFALVVLLQRRHFAAAAVVAGMSMGIYQFSWIIFPFLVLYAFRRRGLVEVGKTVLLAVLGAALIVGPFMASALHRIESNTVGQWGRMPHALADPINLSYWATYVIHPDKLLRLQAVLMIAIFAWCFFRKRCATLEDTLRWATAALTVFVLLNVIVDGYFFLMLLVMMLLYTCVANDWLRAPDPSFPGADQK